MADSLKKHSTFHNGKGRFSGIEYCDKCGYSREFIAETNVGCLKIKNRVVKKGMKHKWSVKLWKTYCGRGTMADRLITRWWDDVTCQKCLRNKPNRRG